MSDDIIPINNKNKNIEELVIGYDYDDLYLQKNNNFKYPEKDYKDYKLYIFNYIYNDEDVIDQDSNNVHVKIAKLKNISYIKKINNYEN
jgi:hypothetical protein